MTVASASAARARALDGLYACGRRIARNMTIVALFTLFAAASMLIAAFVIVGVVGEEGRFVAMPVAIVGLAVGACAFFLRRAAQSYRDAERNRDIAVLAKGIAFETAYWRTAGITTIAVISAITLPMITAAVARRFKPEPAMRTVRQMQVIADALEGYAAEHHHYPNPENLEVLARVLRPYMKQDMPTVDGWQQPFVYKGVCDRQKICFDYRLYSVGANGVVDMKVESLSALETYSCQDCPIESRDLEIVHGDGRFLLIPSSVQVP